MSLKFKDEKEYEDWKKGQKGSNFKSKEEEDYERAKEALERKYNEAKEYAKTGKEYIKSAGGYQSRENIKRAAIRGGKIAVGAAIIASERKPKKPLNLAEMREINKQDRERIIHRKQLQELRRLEQGKGAFKTSAERKHELRLAEIKYKAQVQAQIPQRPQRTMRPSRMVEMTSEDPFKMGSMFGGSIDLIGTFGKKKKKSSDDFLGLGGFI